MTPDRADILRRLEAASVVDERGQRVIRRCVALRIMGLPRSYGSHWERAGHITPRTLVSRRMKNGRTVLWPLHQAARRLSCFARHHRWSDAERDYVADWYGRVSVQAMARHLGVSDYAVIKTARALGITMLNNEGLLSSGDVAAMTGRSRDIVGYWCAHGLPHKRIPSREQRQPRLIRPGDLHKFLMSKPRIWRSISPRHQAMVAEAARRWDLAEHHHPFSKPKRKEAA